MELPAVPLHVAFAPTVVANNVRLASTSRGTSSLRCAKHHGRRALVAGVAILANTLGYRPTPLRTMLRALLPPTVHTTATPEVPIPPPLTLVHPFSQKHKILEAVRAFHHHFFAHVGL